MDETTPRHIRLLTAAGAVTDPDNPTRKLRPVVYAFRLRGGYIKIGYSANLELRRSHLGVTWDDLMAVECGDVHHERAIHRLLTASRHHGHEYYYPTATVLKAVNAMRVSGGSRPIRRLASFKYNNYVA